MYVIQDIVKLKSANEKFSILLRDNENNGYIINVAQIEYDELVNKLIIIKYPNDKMQAVINNYLLDNSEKHVNEFNEMQNYRNECKLFAKEIIAYKKNI